MEISLETIQSLAPDQASLNAAKKLLKPAAWPMRGQAPTLNSIWGQCQGSGASPYMAMADIVDHGYKCTCPSRKFPCKHVLALLWQFADDPSAFITEEPPQWVSDWLGRRRKSSVSTEPSDDKPKPKKSIHLAINEEEPTTALDSETMAKQEAAKVKRALALKVQTETSINQGLNEFQQWVNDQLRSGIGTFIKEINQRCRQIAARLIDAKATNFASRIDELPAKVLELDTEHQTELVIKELGQLILLSECWLRDPEDPDARRAVATTENRESLLNNSDAQKTLGVWETVGEKIQTRRDGLISHATWLLRIDEPNQDPTVALLQDYYPAATGRRDVGLRLGHQMKAEVVFYPSCFPLRAVIARQEPVTPLANRWPTHDTDIQIKIAKQLSQLPWAEHFPLFLTNGRILTDRHGAYWWRSINKESEHSVPLLNTKIPVALLGAELQSAFAVWNGERAELFGAQSDTWGVISC